MLYAHAGHTCCCVGVLTLCTSSSCCRDCLTWQSILWHNNGHMTTIRSLDKQLLTRLHPIRHCVHDLLLTGLLHEQVCVVLQCSPPNRHHNHTDGEDKQNRYPNNTRYELSESTP